MALRYLFVDMNSYFSSVEQQFQPKLRGRPVAVVPMVADTTSCIAVSYEGKAFGVKTGTRVGEARRLCPQMVFVPSNPELYIKTHHKIVEVIESCIHVSQVCSIDEMACKLTGPDQAEPAARKIAGQIKQALRDQIGEFLKCSVGIGPNTLLAKVASDMQKPDGLTVIDPSDLPQRLYGLALNDFPGVGRKMDIRLRAAGITTVEELCNCSQEKLSQVFKSTVMGTLWWHRLRGDDLPEKPTHRRSVGHSHVLPPTMRNADDAHGVITCMLHKAAMRLRTMNYVAQHLWVHVKFVDGRSFDQRVSLDGSRDTLSMIRAMAGVWAKLPTGAPLQVGVTLTELEPEASATLPLFTASQKLGRLAQAMDEANNRFGSNKVFFGGMHGKENRDVKRIAFTRIPELEARDMDDGDGSD